MAATFIHSADILDFNALPNPQSVTPCVGAGHTGEFQTRYHPRVGELKFKSLLFPHVHLMNLHLNSQADVVLYDNTPVDTININFHLAGRLDTTFEGLSHDLRMSPGKHNLVFSPEGGDTNRLAANESLEMFHISLDKAFFSEIIGCDDRWSERVQNNLLYNRPFSGIKGTADTTPLMQSLIRQVKQCGEVGAVRNLMIQSKVFELLALQIEQFRGPGQADSISAADADKLHQLKYFLDTHFLEEHSLAALSRICLLNEFKVKKGFKELFGTTVFGYLRKMRMDYAERMLLDSAQSVEEVSDLLGYEHAQHFSTAFRKYHGVNPSTLKSRRISA
jgi:AraC-like DNA-binding protein